MALSRLQRRQELNNEVQNNSEKDFSNKNLEYFEKKFDAIENSFFKKEEPKVEAKPEVSKPATPVNKQDEDSTAYINLGSINNYKINYPIFNEDLYIDANKVDLNKKEEKAIPTPTLVEEKNEEKLDFNFNTDKKDDSIFKDLDSIFGQKTEEVKVEEPKQEVVEDVKPIIEEPKLEEDLKQVFEESVFNSKTEEAKEVVEEPKLNETVIEEEKTIDETKNNLSSFFDTFSFRVSEVAKQLEKNEDVKAEEEPVKEEIKIERNETPSFDSVETSQEENVAHELDHSNTEVFNRELDEILNSLNKFKSSQDYELPKEEEKEDNTVKDSLKDEIDRMNQMIQKENPSFEQAETEVKQDSELNYNPINVINAIFGNKKEELVEEKPVETVSEPVNKPSIYEEANDEVVSDSNEHKYPSIDEIISLYTKENPVFKDEVNVEPEVVEHPNEEPVEEVKTEELKDEQKVEEPIVEEVKIEEPVVETEIHEETPTVQEVEVQEETPIVEPSVEEPTVEPEVVEEPVIETQVEEVVTSNEQVEDNLNKIDEIINNNTHSLDELNFENISSVVKEEGVDTKETENKESYLSEPIVKEDTIVALSVEEVPVEETFIEEPTVQEEVVETIEEPVVEVQEETPVIEPIVEEKTVEPEFFEEPVIEEISVQETVETEEPTVEETKVEEVVEVEEPKVEETLIEETITEEPTVDESTVEETANEDTFVEEKEEEPVEEKVETENVKDDFNSETRESIISRIEEAKSSDSNFTDSVNSQIDQLLMDDSFNQAINVDDKVINNVAEAEVSTNVELPNVTSSNKDSDYEKTISIEVDKLKGELLYNTVQDLQLDLINNTLNLKPVEDNEKTKVINVEELKPSDKTSTRTVSFVMPEDDIDDSSNDTYNKLLNILLVVFIVILVAIIAVAVYLGLQLLGVI